VADPKTGTGKKPKGSGRRLYTDEGENLLERVEKMDELTIITRLQKDIKESYQQIGDAMIAGTIDNMEKYKYMMGQAHAYLKISQDISNLLNKKEQQDAKGTVIKLNTKD
jgi:hypothetical protein